MLNNNLINLKQSLKCEKIEFTDGNTLENVFIFLLDNFVIVSTTLDMTEPPTWYNINIIKSMQKVEKYENRL